MSENFFSDGQPNTDLVPFPVLIQNVGTFSDKRNTPILFRVDKAILLCPFVSVLAEVHNKITGCLLAYRSADSNLLAPVDGGGNLWVSFVFVCVRMSSLCLSKVIVENR